MPKIKILISACLLGENVKYSGGNNLSQILVDFLEKNEIELLPVCPEVLGGLSTPRLPAEIIYGKVVDQAGNDVSKAFQLGAEKTLKIAQDNYIQFAILKEKSPSCGSQKIYDGSFSGRLIDGHGMTTQLLQQHHIHVFSELNYQSIAQFINK
ncbi:DUF523 domain-containing protein [Mannheimia massilioguelmaensis]|uniref:DUF523 domain-containing protein n=1 Tax=Mannheimia massilioguelmaensis TaxID=1604354 RepID=UPI0005C9873B|nr:DUF523 domain-containing protein [Mannheimia massilioguelmaensis]